MTVGKNAKIENNSIHIFIHLFYDMLQTALTTLS